jgi:DNA modification methylase
MRPMTVSYEIISTLEDVPSPVDRNLVLVGDALAFLRRLPDQFVRTCVTSPPYWGLRDYDFSAQIGAETELADYLSKLTEVFAEVHRVLTDDGTFWLNIGDSYTSGNRTWRDGDKKNPARSMTYRPPTPPGLKPKDLIGVPWRLAFALQDAGWYLRSDIIWHKPNCQPESVKDRPTRSHEYLFLFSKSEKYYYDHQSIQEMANGSGKTRNRRSVWSINTEAFPGAHFATFPVALVEPCILAGSEPGDFVLDPFLGSGTVAQVATLAKRRFIGIEIKPDYAAIAVSRLGGLYQRRRLSV